MIKSMEPYTRKLGTQTWFYVKRCFTALIEAMACAPPATPHPHLPQAKQLVAITDTLLQDSVDFFTACECLRRRDAVGAADARSARA